jgi:hypothetical protein
VSWRVPLDRSDRNLLLGCGVLVAMLIVALGFFLPPREGEEDPTPSSYSTAKRGARAAFELLRKSGYRVERQNAPLAEIVNQVDEHTTLVIADPYMQDVVEARGAVKQVLERGGRVLVTGYSGALLVPGNGVEFDRSQMPAECDAEPNGFGDLADSGKVRVRTEVRWKRTDPMQSVEYTCNGQAVVVSYPSGKGQVVWWTSSFPLENIGIQQEDNLALFLNSVGPAASTHIIWDESLHGEIRSLWSYADGTPIHWIWWQLAIAALLLVLSYGRRSGPLRPDPIVSRATPLEFVHSLGSLYQKAGATNTAVAIACQRFRHKLEKQFGISQTLAAEATTLLEGLTSRFGSTASRIQKDLASCENAAGEEKITTREALALVQALRDDEGRIDSRYLSGFKADP